MLLGVGQSSRVMGSCQEDVKLSPQEIISLCNAIILDVSAWRGQGYVGTSSVKS